MADITFDDLIPSGGSGLSFDDLIPKQNTTGIAEDVAKSGAAGVGRGVAGLPGIFGDVHELAKMAPFAPKRSMYDALTEKLGFTPPTSQETVAAAGKVVPGLDYQPQTTAGKFARTVGEFVPGAALGGGGVVRNTIKFGAVPGVASETAGQAFEGTPYETAARLAGGAAGVFGHNLPGKVISPLTQRPEIAAAVKTLEAEGVPLTAGQKTGNKALRWIEAAAADMPLSGTSAAEMNANQGAALNRAFASRMGHQITDPNGLMTEAEWKAAKAAFDTRYNQLNSNSVMRHDPQLQAAVDSAVSDYNAITAPNARAGAIEKWAQDITDIPTTHNGALSGDTYQSWRSDIARQARNSGPGSKEEIALKDLNRALDDAINRSTHPALAPVRSELNRDYANYKALQEAAKSASVGAAQDYIPANLVRNKAARRSADYLTGRSDLGKLAKAAKAVMEPLPNSGTAQRTAAMNMFVPQGAAGAGFLAGGAPGLLAGYVGPTIMARTLLGRPAQKYLSNQAAQRLGLIGKATKRQKAMGLLGSVDAMDE